MPPGGGRGAATQDITDSKHLQEHLPAPWPSSEVRAETGALGVMWPCPPATLADQAPTSTGGARRGETLSFTDKRECHEAS